MESTFTRQQYNEQVKNDKRQFSENKRSLNSSSRRNTRNRKKSRNSWLFDKYPKELVFAFNFNPDNIMKFNKIVTNFSKGRHILDLSALDIIMLQKRPINRKKALSNICSFNVASELGIMEMENRDLFNISDYVYEKIQEGLKIKIKDLGLNIYLTPDRIINSGKVLKNHEGQKEYGGMTIRDYITYYIKQEKCPELSEEDKVKIEQGINSFLIKLGENGYVTLKSVPFSVMRMETHIKVGENNEIVSPDIEAKDNIRKIIKPELYEQYGFNKLSAVDATIYELKLFKMIKPYIKEEIKKELLPLLGQLPKSRITADIKQSIQLDNIAMISKKGRIQDIVDYMYKNTKTIADLESNKSQWNRRLTEEEIQSIFQIEYASMPANTDDNMAFWITDLSLAMKCIYATYPMIKTLIDNRIVPTVNGMPITRYTNDYIAVDKLIQESKNYKEPKAYFEEKAIEIFKIEDRVYED